MYKWWPCAYNCVKQALYKNKIGIIFITGKYWYTVVQVTYVHKCWYEYDVRYTFPTYSYSTERTFLDTHLTFKKACLCC